MSRLNSPKLGAYIVYFPDSSVMHYMETYDEAKNYLLKNGIRGFIARLLAFSEVTITEADTRVIGLVSTDPYTTEESRKSAKPPKRQGK